ncbi:hypothetical protein TGRUB_313475 [Toxoplasma gondii RUB]|uniref:Uncharacterized protein n=9 Tax=Toxoplasma gondii TaxID=5811 RepID=S7W1F1_TOXGG|nr:hypothetical protein TGGT1_313475 [Toxoplasma gondii GT1]KFG37479.1 hypothetical protein TGDOM2_313475 [Toxoplasma gondii GAB2-2007-GAL-DOM2]KFG50027.1 hypothetical protein TGP89_313475 [Toxoplasma gondii p89]KFG56137.1 hypothetical protein TGFOU_313475 [Toxoplasma gondii FOU]KFG66127.1 hypothetical protein TGRUB_313475 [Toxoplasma gondii RUB]KFH09831.1 hypothetical protein TGVAND_313475 [Toxoplasma gondii VAND]KFH17787.1 hypothetical protein TGMAS_313475 [Toxoplasma gondii MAS]PUA91591.1
MKLVLLPLIRVPPRHFVSAFFCEFSEFRLFVTISLRLSLPFVLSPSSQTDRDTERYENLTSAHEICAHFCVASCLTDCSEQCRREQDRTPAVRQFAAFRRRQIRAAPSVWLDKKRRSPRNAERISVR